MSCLFFFFNDTATTEIYTLSLHDALPIFAALVTPSFASSGILDNNQISAIFVGTDRWLNLQIVPRDSSPDRKSTRLNSSHANISYAVFCLKKKKKNQ